MVARKLIFLIVCSFALSFASESVNAQSEGRIRLVIPRIDRAEDDLKWLIELSPTADLKKQWKKLKEDVLDAFTQGFDLALPIEFDFVFRKDELGYDFRIPVADFDGRNGLLKCIEGIGFIVKPITKGSFYEIFEKGKKPYYLRYDKGYAWVSRSKESLPEKPPAAAHDMGPLLEMKKDVLIQLKNEASGLAARRDAFAELRKQFESLIKIRRNEDKAFFDLRKQALSQQLDEAEPFIVETDQLVASWITATEGPTPLGRGELLLTALPGTELQKSIEEFAGKPSYFANVELHPHPVASGKMNFALSEPRIKRAKEFYKTVRPTLESKIDARTGETPAQKTAAKQATNKFLDLLNQGTELRTFDAFIDAHSADGGKNALVSGLKVMNGKSVDEILEALKGMKSGWQVEKLEDHGGVAIHKLTVPKDRLDNFRKFFADESAIYVGTSKDAVWGAAGVDAVKKMKTAIDQAAQPAPAAANPVFLHYKLQLAKLANLTDAIKLDAPSSDAPKTKEQEKAEKDAQKKLERLSKLAEDTMKGCDSLIHGELKRNGNAIEGFLEVNECALKYIGAVFADQVKELVQ